MSGKYTPQAFVADLHGLLVFMTRLPLPRLAGGSNLARALRLAPLAGLVVGAMTGAVFWLAVALGLPAPLAALLAVLSGLLLTGALHEDGLADCADSLGVHGASDRQRQAKRLAVMRDSRIGAFGACALIFSIALRAAALAALEEPGLVFAALLAAHAGGRGILPLVMLALAPAGGGFAATLGRMQNGDVLLALGLLAVILIALFGWLGLAVLGLVLAVAAASALWAKRAFGGFTGDVLGAIEQLGEIAVLVLLAAA